MFPSRKLDLTFIQKKNISDRLVAGYLHLSCILEYKFILFILSLRRILEWSEQRLGYFPRTGRVGSKKN